MSNVHKYFNCASEEWSIRGFLEKCDIEPFDQKLDCYTKSLEAIANNERGSRGKKAQLLLNKYKQKGNGSDSQVAKSWNNERSHSKVYLHQPTITCENISGFNGLISMNKNGIFASGSTISKRDYEESDDDFMPVHQPKRKKQLSLPKKAKTTKDTPSSSPGVPNLSSSSSLREQVKATNTNADDDDGDFISSNKSTISRSHWKDTQHTPPHQIYSISENQNLLTRLRNEKQRAKSTMEPICSNIVDTTNKNLMERLQYQYDHRWEPVINDATKYIDKLIENSDTRNDLRNKLLLPFIPSGETYSFSKHYEVHWVHRFADKLSLFFEAPRNPLLDKNSEGWLNCHIFAPLIDDCFLICEEIHVHRCEEMSLASIMRKNLTREESEKKSSGHKIDIIFRVDDVEYFSAETYVDEDPQNSKPISYKHKLFREMKDQLDRLLKKLEFTKESIKEVKNIFVHGMSHGGLNGKIYAMYYNIDLEYYFVYEMCRYRIGTTWSSVPDSLMTLKKILCLKCDINKVLGVIKKVKRVRLYSKPEDLFSINNLPDTTPSPKKKQNK
ncbi:C2H2-type zinc finger transcription factor [Rhizophagus clarus]|uniref:C2H2-type zinc finger transcription factor n=1 Tax=Rhizophagus clarus TaxID=94130 RepID=A0A8H3LNZ9_9GLOM|nr:C2H2-type zinc finger transcription factor [Rhizophagus clarus]